MEREVKAFAPASVSNVACGFDIMGFALDQPGDIVTLRFSGPPGVRVKSVSGTSAPISLDPLKNTAAAPVAALLKHNGTKTGVEIEINKGIPVGGGIGSSAASAVAAAVACNELLGMNLTKDELLPYAVEGEKIASGAIHVDNLSPCLWGGFILVRGYHPIDLVHIRVPKDLWCTVIHPDIEIRTKESRKLLPREVPLDDLITHTGNAAGLIAGLLQGDFGLIGRSLQDVVAEPARKHTIPGFDAMKEASLRAGAFGCSISGSGPSLFALSKTEETAQKVGEAMGKVLDSLQCSHTMFVSGICRKGARVIS
jgi:homoserine kinase